MTHAAKPMGRLIAGLDPGPVESALVVWDGSRILHYQQSPNGKVMDALRGPGFINRIVVSGALLVIEQVASYGMPVGEEVFETVFWSGRFAEAFGIARVARIKRLDVKMALCHDSRAKDGNIRQALIDRYGPPGTKKAPGTLYGITKDLWSALAVAVAWSDVNAGQKGAKA